MPNASASADFPAEWRIVDSLDKQGLYKSALEKVEAIHARAKAENNGGHVLKSLIFRGKYTTMLDEDGFVKAVQNFETEAKTAPQPQKSVLESLLGELYATYLQNQQWSLRDRTPVSDEGGDILTWSAAQIERHALDLYAASVREEGLLRATPAEYLREVTTQGRNDTATAPLRPTLFDFLAHRALDHFSNERSFLTEPAFKFYLDQPEAFAPGRDFVRAKFESKDTTSGKWLAVNLFRTLTATHLTDPDPSALIDLELKRLAFARQNSVLEDKKSRYQQALEVLHKSHYDHPSDAETIAALAELLIETDSENPQSKGENLKRAVTECEDAIRRHPKSFGAGQCRQLLAQIRQPSLNVDVEQAYLPEKPMLASVSLKNVSRIWVKVVNLPAAEFNPFEGIDWDKRLDFLNGLDVAQQREWDVPLPRDYQNHRTEIALDGLPAGHWALVVADNKAFSDKMGAVAFVPFATTRLAPVAMRENGSSKIVVADRESGSPLAGVKADFFTQRYDYQARANRQNFVGSAMSDANGWLQAKFPAGEGGLTRLSAGTDTLWLGWLSDYEPYRQTEQRSVHFFTDRSIYRPGQTVYFKGILLNNSAERLPSIVPNSQVLVKFLDANYQEKNRLSLKTNEFGTFNGAFAAPTGGLTGQMTIQVEGTPGAAYFNVEEYKRPKFEVAFKPVEGSFRLGEAVTVRGEAKNYAGSVLDGAQVKYRVVRQARFPFWDFGWWRPMIWNTSQMEITNGTATTGADGSFDIKFDALPDRSIPKKDLPMFDFTVFADVTDITGETRSNQTAVSAGYVALNVDFSLGQSVELDSLRRVRIGTSNSAGQFQPAKLDITLQRLVEPRTIFTKRYWEEPDVATLAEADFREKFPAYAWRGEDNPEKWGREDFMQPFTFNTTAAGQTFDLNAGKVQPGWYAVVLKTKDSFGEPIEIKRVVQVWDAKNRRTQFREPQIFVEKETFEPGETARVWLGGQTAGLQFFVAIERNGQLENPRWLKTVGAEKIEITVAESDRGGLTFHAFAVRDNRFYGHFTQKLDVPWTNKDLKITFETFRDKLLPGQKEEWRLRISGPKKDKVAAELVAAMYDASLDQFLQHSWNGVAFPDRFSQVQWQPAQDFGAQGGEPRYSPRNEGVAPESRAYRMLNWFGFPLYGGRYRGNVMAMKSMAPMVDGVAMESAAPAGGMNRDNYQRPEVYPLDKAEGPNIGTWTKDKPAPAPPAQIRRNLQETVFFFPELRTDANGDVLLKFTMGEALTRWKLLAFAHTKDLKNAVATREVVTQKELMIIANPPRFFREGDEIEFSAKISNLSQETQTGTASLGLLDAATMQVLERDFGLETGARVVNFTVPAGQSTAVSWRLKVPFGKTSAVTWQIFAEGKTARDGEESTLPVVTNRMLVTETMPITVRGGQTKTFVFDNLKSLKSPTLASHRYTLEFTSNPAWLAVQSLPYMMEYPHECSEQVFSRFYANALAASVAGKYPNIRKVFEKWRTSPPSGGQGGAMLSNLAKNQELKNALLEETPWVMDAQNEAQQKQNIALLFDLNRMADEQTRALAQLAERQNSDGSWSWFPGGPPSWHTTQHILTGLAKLQKLGAFDWQNDQTTMSMTDLALGFCDRQVREQYAKLEQEAQAGRAKLEDNHLDGMVIQYLYMKSFFGKIDRPERAFAYYLGQAQKFWLGNGLYQEGMLAMALHRFGMKEDAQKIARSLRERSIQKEELGMYWVFDWGYYWYQLPVETQAMMVEVFDEVADDPKAVDELRIWLLKNKQTNNWESTKATAEAVYALLLRGQNWLDNARPVSISLGGKTLKTNDLEAGTGYFKQAWGGAEVKPSLAEIKVENPNSNMAWGAAYWQYFEDLDKITSFKKTPLTIVKQLFREDDSATGKVLTPIADGQPLKRGDRVKVRIEIRVDRPMEYVHLKDMRASGFEPVNVLSGYRWGNGLGYYESTKDLATHFFMDYLPRGTFVFEYPLVVSQRGDFSNGITTMECMYAPEFSSHSQGVRVRVE
ncbi:MAG: alpha-2-macroglobulin family protein [Saprospiraceae bacterium]